MDRRRSKRRTRHDRVLAVLHENASSLLRLARQHSLCADDAQDAYQRALEIYLRKVEDIDDETAGSWLRTVVKHEAMALRDSRQRILSNEDIDFDSWIGPLEDSEERAISFERMERAAEALQHCKHHEVSAMWLKAEGHSYAEICEITGWSYTKVNRCLAEGRARFLKTYAAIESGEECRRLAPALSAIADGEAELDDFDTARRHLRNCAGCRATLRELSETGSHVHAVLPVGVLAGTGLTDEVSIGLLGRAWETLVMGVQDRVVAAGMKVHMAVEAASVSKVAAVAASAAAVAGGGAVAVEQAAVQPRSAEAHQQVKATPEPAETPAAESPVPTPVTPAATAVPEPTQANARSEPVSADTSTPAEFGFESAQSNEDPQARISTAPAATPAPAKRPAATPTRSASKPRGESFGFER
jgi:RNA polymerase sigma factor (sigma-70 family)